MAQYFARLDAHPAVAAWYARITEREGFVNALPQKSTLFNKEFYAPWPLV